jgi:hypothetical protein
LPAELNDAADLEENLLILQAQAREALERVLGLPVG